MKKLTIVSLVVMIMLFMALSPALAQDDDTPLTCSDMIYDRDRQMVAFAFLQHDQGQQNIDNVVGSFQLTPLPGTNLTDYANCSIRDWGFGPNWLENKLSTGSQITLGDIQNDGVGVQIVDCQAGGTIQVEQGEKFAILNKDGNVEFYRYWLDDFQNWNVFIWGLRPSGAINEHQWMWILLDEAKSFMTYSIDWRQEGTGSDIVVGCN